MSYKYLADGQQVYVNKKVEDGAIVTPLYEYYDDHAGSLEVEGNPMYYDDAQLFDKPPVKLLEADVAKIHAEIAILEERRKQEAKEVNETVKLRQKTERDLAAVIRDHNAALDSLPINHVQLKNLRLFFEGGIRYVVETSYQDYWMPQLIDSTDKVGSSQLYSNSLALLTLNGSLLRSDPSDVRWTLDRRPSERSGSGSNATLHDTLEDAVATFATAMARHARHSRGKVDQAYMDALKRFNLEPDEYAVKRFEQTKQAEAKAKREKAEAAIAAAQRELENI